MISLYRSDNSASIDLTDDLDDTSAPSATISKVGATNGHHPPALVAIRNNTLVALNNKQLPRTALIVKPTVVSVNKTAMIGLQLKGTICIKSTSESS